MPVVINEFEVIATPSPQEQPRAGSSESEDEKWIPAEQEIVNVMRRQVERLRRVFAH